MKRKLISFCTATVMAATCISSVYAESVKDIITALPNYEQNYKNVDLKVESDIELRSDGVDTYDDGPITTMIPTSTSSALFDYRATLYMKSVRDEFTHYWNVAKLLCAGDSALEKELDEVPVSGEFTIKITYPSSMTIPDSIKETGNMVGFNDDAKYVFKDVERSVSNNTLTIKIKVKDPSNDSKEYVLGKTLNDNLEKYLADLTLTCEGVSVNGTGAHRVIGEVTGFTKIGDYTLVTGTAEDPIATVTYTAVQQQLGKDQGKTSIYEDVILVTPTPTPGGGGGRSGGSSSGGGLIAGSGTPVPTTPAVPTIVPGYPETSAELDRSNHYAYIIGYPEGIVKPNNYITRAEVTTILFRMLTDKSRAEMWTTENSYSDVNEDDWFNNAVSTVFAAKVVQGYEDGTFRPNNSITRAEFAAIIARFIGGKYEGIDRFGDINGHWAEEAINRASLYGWISGYEDSTYRPDQNITRAEAMTLMNNVLNRHVEEDGMLDDMVKWSDNTPDKWYYTAVQEATNSHYFERDSDDEPETWISIRDPRDWAALETETATAASAGSEASAFSGE